jgi:hypothetical protein
MQRGVVIVDSIVLFVAHKHIINKQINKTNKQTTKKERKNKRRF